MKNIHKEIEKSETRGKENFDDESEYPYCMLELCISQQQLPPFPSDALNMLELMLLFFSKSEIR